MDSLQAAMGTREEPASTGPPGDGSRRPLRRSPMPLRLCSDEELVRRFRAGDEDAFRAIHDRYRTRLFAYARQMLRGSRQDAEEALQDVFVRAHAALRTDARDVSLRAWLYRIAHNRCIDELRRPEPPGPELLALLQPLPEDPIAVAIRRESLRRLVTDIGRLPEQQRAALLMRELGGMSYDEVAAALTITVASVKSTLTRARMSLTSAAQARGAACHDIRTQLAAAHERGVRFDGLVRRHLHDCDDCRAYRRELQTTARRLAALAPTLGPGTLLAKLFGGVTLLGGGAGTAASIGGGATAGGATAGGGLLTLSGGQLAALAAAGAIGIGGGIVALDARSGSTPRRHRAPQHQLLAVAPSTNVALTRPSRVGTVPTRTQAAPKPTRAPRSVTVVGRPRAQPAWATPRYRSMRKQLARISGFHLVWRDGALEPVGLENAPRDPQARAQWIDAATVNWLVSSVGGRRLVEQMRHLPRGMVVALDSDGNWSSWVDRPGRSEAARTATGMAGSMWLTMTPQGRRAYRRLRARARRRADAHPAPPSTATTPAAPVPAVTTTQPSPSPVTTPTTPAPTVTTPPPSPPPATTPAPTVTTPPPSTTTP